MDESAVNAIMAQLTANAGPVQGDNGASAYIVPDGYSLVPTTNTKPVKIVQRVSFSTMKSFLDYVLRHGSSQGTAVFVGDSTAKAVIDYHSTIQPGTCLHEATLDLNHSTEWKNWTQRSGSKMSQMQFAEFVDEFADDFREPDGATMLELATTLKASGSINFSSKASLTSGGVNFSYSEEIEGQAGRRGQLTIPEKFVIAIPVFDRGVRFEVRVRLLWSVKDGNLQIGYRLYRPDLIKQAARDEMFDAIAETGFPTYHGNTL